MVGLIGSLICCSLVGFGGGPLPRTPLALTTDECPSDFYQLGAGRFLNSSATKVTEPSYPSEGFFKDIASMSTMYYTLFGFLVCMILGSVTSLVINCFRPSSPVPIKLIAPFFRVSRISHKLGLF
jgi:hypothetical protein